MEYKYNMKSPAVKRLMREAQELNEPSEEYYAQPVEENLFEWHFTVRGPPDSEFDGGIYHGRIILPPEYPMKPPSIILLTPNGRFEVNKKICLSISGYHPESWQPSWSIRTALLAIIGFMPTQGLGAIGSLDYTADERKALAHGSHDWVCPLCGPIRDSLMKLQNTPRQVNEEARDLASRISFKGEVERVDKNQDVSVGNEPSNKSWRSLENANADASYDSNVRNRLESSIHAVSEVNESLTDTSQVHQRKPQVVLQNKETTSSRETTIQSSTSVSTIIVILLVCAIIGLMFRRLFIL